MSPQLTGLPRRQRGFTLLEVLAAFVIFALIFATTLQVLSGALRNTQRSADYTQAALWAQTAMESLGLEPVLEEGSYAGDFEDGYWWEMDILPYEIDESDPLNVPQSTALAPVANPVQDAWQIPIDLFEIELRVYWGEPGAERMARFRTLRSITPLP